MSSLRRGPVRAVATVAVALVAASALTACGSSSESKANSNYAPTSNVVYNPVNGISLDSTTIKVRNLYLLAAQGIVAPRLRMTLVNTTEDREDALVGATVGLPTVTGRLFGGTAGAVTVPASSTVLIGSDLGPQITFPGFNPTPGTYVPVVLLFRTGRTVAGSILVQDAVSLYSDGTVPQGVPDGRPTEAALPPGEGDTAVTQQDLATDGSPR